MEFGFTAEEEAFRAELRAFLAAELPAWWRGMFVDDERVFPETRRICAALAARGWLTMAWPREYGGQGASVWKQAILREEMWAHHEPRGPQYMNLNYIGPCIMRFGTPAQKARFLPPMAAGQVLWTQGFSEPGAGSDLAALTTRADDHGDHFVVTGQKCWNSYADAPADWCMLLARTDPRAERHRGLSVLLVDMRTPGIRVRPVGSMAGPHELNEIFLDEVRVPRECLLGEQDRGWDVVLEAARLLNYRAISLQAAGEVPAVEAAIARVHNTQLEQAVGHVGLELLGVGAQLVLDAPGAPLGGLLHQQWVRNVPTTIVAGTLEIQKSLIAERGLGLPRSR